MFQFRYISLSDKGHCRTCNEDACGAMDNAPGGRGAIWTVADGMGGHHAGDIASRIAVNTLLLHYPTVPGARPDQWLERAFAWANQDVLDYASQHPEAQGMGTTLCALAIVDGQASVAGIGDSRIYLLRGDGCIQLTEDDTVVSSQIRDGHLTEAEAALHPKRNILTKALGTADYSGPGSVSRLPVADQDVFLLCSDGLYTHVAPEEFIPLVADGALDDAGRGLLDLALTRGGSDNITLLLVHVSVDTSATFSENTLSYSTN